MSERLLVVLLRCIKLLKVRSIVGWNLLEEKVRVLYMRPLREILSGLVVTNVCAQEDTGLIRPEA